MKNLFILLIFLSSIMTSYAQSNAWVKQLSGSDLKNVKIAEDADANLFIAGMFTDSLQLDSQTLIFGLGSFNLFVAKYDPSQQLQNFKIYSTDYEFERPFVKHLEVDGAGQVYLGGNFYQGLYDMEGDTLLYTLASLDEFVAKFDNDLNRNWIHRIGGSNNTDAVNKIEIGANGELYLSGAMSRSFDYDLSDSSFTIQGANSGSPFLVKYDSALQLQWAQVLQSVGYEAMLDVEQSGDGSVYTISQVSDTIFVPVAGDTLLVESQGGLDLMISKWSDTGDILWTQLITGTAAESFLGLEIDAEGYPIVLVQSNSPIISIGENDLDQKKGADLVLVRFSPKGQVEWINQIPSSSNERQGKLLMRDNHLIISGIYSTELILNSRGELIDIPVLPGEDYLATYSLSGDLLQAVSLAEGTMLQKSDLRINASGQILVAAALKSPTSFFPLPSGGLDLLNGENVVIGKFCFLTIPDLAVDSTCLDGQQVLLSDVNASSTRYYFPQTGEEFTDIDSLWIPSDISKVVVAHFDQNSCPIYQEIDAEESSCSSTSAQNYELAQRLLIHPNPFTENPHLSWSGKARFASIYVYGNLGQLMFKSTVDKDSRLKFEGLPNGIYFLRIDTELGSATKKIIKL